MKQGFTLIELLVVVLIIGILSAVALPQYTTAVERSRATEALTLMNAVQTALERYHAQHDTFPDNTDNKGFKKLDVEIPQVNGSYGGKYFTITFTSGGLITATRKRESHAYQLTTTVTPQNDGTYSAVRKCEAVTGGSLDDDATAYCNAISGGNPNNF